MDSDLIVFFMAILCGFMGGVLSYIAIHWGHIRFQLGLDYRLSDLEGRLAREVKIRASTDTQKKASTDRDLLEAIKNAPQKEELTMANWRTRAFTKS